MSAEGVIRDAVVTALRGDGALMALVNGVYDGAVVGANEPYALVAECLGADWGANGVEGREIRVAITLADKGETPDAIAAMLGRVEAAMRGLEGATAGGWRVITLRFLRSRVARPAPSQRRDGGWQALAEYRVRAVFEG